MAMEKQYVVRETHTRTITALGYNPVRREILMGCEDGVIKTWEAENGKLVQTSHEHKGWVTDFIFWQHTKLMLSSSNDGVIIAWSAGGGVHDRITVGQPVYCMALNPRRQQLICGINGGIQVYDLDNEKESGNVINQKVAYTAIEHTDIVRCLVCWESRVYSAGYDHKLIIYDSSYTGDKSMTPIYVNHSAHDAGISCLMLVKDNENNTWIVTGSFDKTVRIWSPDGKLVHKLDGFMATVTGICYVPRNKTIWAAGGTSYASLYDPKSGDNLTKNVKEESVSDFIGTFQNQEEEKYMLQLLKYFPELNQVVATTSRRHLMVWKYNTQGCITALKCRAPLESLAYTHKVPILIFSGDNEGIITKWERMQSNHFMYSKELFLLSEAKKAKKKKKKEDSDKEHRTHTQNRINRVITSHYTFNKPTIPPLSMHTHPNTTVLQIVFVEALDLIVAASEDANIYVWGFDDKAVQVLKGMKPQDTDNLIKKYRVLLDSESELLPQNSAKKVQEEDSVTNRVAGFICKHIFSEHSSCVTSLAVVGRENGFKSTYVLSAGWDRRILIWDLEQGCLHDMFRNTAYGATYDSLELASDGIILNLAYNPSRNEFAYAASDKMVYIRKFSPNGAEMHLLNTLQGHYGEVTCVHWSIPKEKWVTGSEDGTIRIWAGEGLNECEQVLSAQGSVTAMCIDMVNGSIVAGVQDVIRVYESEQYCLVQCNVGHSDAVRSVIHIPERNQYVSSSWDRTIRIWNAWKMPKKKRRVSKDNKLIDTKMDMWSVEDIAEEDEGEEHDDEGEGQ